MKKNLISVLILALTFVNFILTALLLFTVLPETKKANELVEKVCSAIDLELNSGSASGISDIPIDDVTTFALNGGEKINMNLKMTDDGEPHYAVIKVSLSLNTKSDNYKKYSPEVLKTKEEIIRNNVIQIVGDYTLEQLSQDSTVVQNAILKDMQGMFGSDYVVGVNFSDMTYQ